MDYVGGDQAISEIERDKLSLQEVKGFLKDHLEVKDSMKMYFHVPGTELAEGLVFLHDDIGCVHMAEYVCVDGVADVFVEYHGEEENVYNSSGSDFEDDYVNLFGEKPDEIISAEVVKSDEEIEAVVSQVCNPSQVPSQRPSFEMQEPHVLPETEDSGDSSDSSDDNEYMPHSEDSGEDSEVVELRKHARKFKKRMKDSKSWINSDSPVPVNLIANMEEQIGDEEKDWNFESSDEDYSYDEDSDGEIKRRKSKYLRFNPKADIPHFALEMVFRSKNQVCKALRRYGIVTKRSIVFIKSEVDRVRAKCGWPGCPWLIYVAKSTRCSRFQVITYEDEHRCANNRDNKLVTAKVIAQRYEHFILANPMWKIESMQSTVLQDMCADVSTSKCKHAKKLVMDRLMCGLKNEYTRVFDYQLELLRSNPGSTVAVCLDPTNMHQNIFQSFYVCFDALKKGFKAGCRRVIGLDGCFFKGAVKGELLCAIGRDANNQMYPVAWAVVEHETNETWAWFIGLLIKDLDIHSNGAGWVFISDQQKCLIKAMKDYLPGAEHRMCTRHIYANWRKKYRAHEWQKKLWAVAKAANKQDFNYYKAKLAQETPDGVKDMMRTQPEHWARSFFSLGSHCESIDNNMCESFNHAIVEARFYPIISMQEKIRKKIFVRIQEQRKKAEKFHGKICPSIFNKLKASIARTQFMEVLWNGKDGFEVKLLTGRRRQYTVSLDKRSCSCGYFQLSGIPCSHAITAIYKCGKLVEDYIAPCYSIDVFKKIYEHCLQPVEGEEMWPISEKPRPQAPGYVRMPGRPKKNNRRREEQEKPKTKKMSKHGIVIVCSLCGNPGHNKSGCKNNPERGKKKYAHLVKTSRKTKTTEVLFL
jgi:hypothetical protein